MYKIIAGGRTHGKRTGGWIETDPIDRVVLLRVDVVVLQHQVADDGVAAAINRHRAVETAGGVFLHTFDWRSAVIVLRAAHVHFLVTRRDRRVEIGAEGEAHQAFIAGQLAIVEVHDLRRDAAVHVVTKNAPHVVDGAETAAGPGSRRDARGIVNNIRRIAGRL